jgi:hypothetical protein
MSQKCSKCEIDKPLSEYYVRSETGNYRKDCKECMTKQKRKLREKNTIKNKEKLKIVDKTQIKTCSNCNVEKQLSKFSISPANKSGFYSWCLVCSRKKDNDRKKIRKEYTETDIKDCSQCNKSKNILKNYSKKIGTQDGYSNICKECIKIYRKSISKELYQKKKHKLNSNIQYKLTERIRGRLRILLGDIKVKKPKTEKLIDCTLDNFIKHLDKSFYEDITFDNYGTVWHLDHIIPCDWFDLTDINQLKACTHYTNLQALLIKDNCIKSNKLDCVHPKSGYQITFLRLIYNKFITLPKLII